MFNRVNELKLFINNEEHSVKPEDVPPNTTLNNYLRNTAHLTGTKNMCMEGGCGACIVAVGLMDPIENREVVMAVNSCLVPVYLCANWKIYTIEQIGNSKTGYHPVQKALVEFNGTQCGFCSPGMVMNMYALYESGKFTMKDVENSFGGNMCRCTGYRSILSAFKSLASDASSELLQSSEDIEDIPVCKRSQGECRSKCQTPCREEWKPHYYDFGESKWFKCFSINEILDVIRNNNNASYMIVGGNTAEGVYKKVNDPDLYIDATCVKSLLEHTIKDDCLILGANMTLTNTMGLFYKLAKENPKFGYLGKMADHIDLIANVSVRNTGTLAGNLCIKHEHHEFPSDVYLILETVGATLTIVSTDHQEVTKSLVDFQSFDMKGKIIKSITLPALGEGYKYESYKIMPQAQNCPALVNAGFLLKLGNNKVESARIVYGSINPNFIHAKNAEQYLVGKNLFENATLQGLFQTLNSEIIPDHVLPDSSPEFRKKLAISLCYKFILSIAPDDKISARNKSGGSKQTRPVSSAIQDYETNKSMYPVTQPISKIEALAQCSGTAKYIMDMPDQPGQLHAAFVLAKAPPNSVINNINASEALQMEGVEAFYDKNDIPGENNFTPKEGLVPLFHKQEEIFCSGVVQYYFQPVGLIVATSHELAQKAADMVHIIYTEGKQKPLVTIRDVLAANVQDQDKIVMEGKTEAKTKGTDVKHVLKGKMDISWQYHYYMETQCCVVVPTEDGLDMYPSTQNITLAQTAAAKALNIPINKINATVRRVGGSFGGKVSRNSLISTAAAIAAYKLNKPIKLSLPLVTNMNLVGQRSPFSVDYEVGVNDKGTIQYLNASLYSDLGNNGGNENMSGYILQEFGNLYNRETWNVNMFSTKTDTPTSTFCRSPGSTEASSAGEIIMQHISTAFDLDPLKVRLQNLDTNQQNVAKYIDQLVKWAEVEKRRTEVEEFNKANRWVKQGISVVPLLFPMEFYGYWHVQVSVYQGDGSVAVAHGGIEMGQGINTKVAQVCAYALGIPLDKVSIKPTNDLLSANAATSGGSITSETMCYATIKACQILKDRMEPIKSKMKSPTWLELVQECFLKNVNLTASSLYESTLPDIHSYVIYGAACVETEVDILTGVYQFKRVDILEDTGNSISPKIDIGQVEGAFIMGLGYWTTEKMVITDEGQLLTNRTWNYKPPGTKDIPIDFRVKFPKDNPNELTILHSKATSLPPFCMACAAPFAIRNAVGAARGEADPKAEKWYPIDGPSTVENTFLNSLHDYKQYVL